MQPSDITPQSYDPTTGELLVWAQPGTSGMSWVAIIEWQGKKFKFRSNEVQSIHQSDDCGGIATYLQVL
jgi:hypothetical protein